MSLFIQIVKGMIMIYFQVNSFVTWNIQDIKLNTKEETQK